MLLPFKVSLFYLTNFFSEWRHASNWEHKKTKFRGASPTRANCAGHRQIVQDLRFIRITMPGRCVWCAIESDDAIYDAGHPSWVLRRLRVERLLQSLVQVLRWLRNKAGRVCRDANSGVLQWRVPREWRRHHDDWHDEAQPDTHHQLPSVQLEGFKLVPVVHFSPGAHQDKADADATLSSDRRTYNRDAQLEAPERNLFDQPEQLKMRLTNS